MIIRQSETSTDAVIMTPDELREEIDREARARLGISGDTFIHKWMRKDLPDTEAASDIGILVRLLGAEKS